MCKYISEFPQIIFYEGKSIFANIGEREREGGRLNSRAPKLPPHFLFSDIRWKGAKDSRRPIRRSVTLAGPTLKVKNKGGRFVFNVNERVWAGSVRYAAEAEAAAGCKVYRP